MSTTEPPRKKPSFIQTLLSVLGAFLGVQSQKTRERDFESGHPWWVYALLGVGIALCFIVTLVFIVNRILN